MILVKRQGFIDFVNASASIRAVLDPPQLVPTGRVLKTAFLAIPCPQGLSQCRKFNSQSFILDLLGHFCMQVFDQAHAVRHPNVFHLHLALLVPVCHRHQFACHFAQDTSQSDHRAPLHSEVRTTQPAAWLCTHVSVSTKRIRSHGCCDLSPSKVQSRGQIMNPALLGFESKLICKRRSAVRHHCKILTVNPIGLVHQLQVLVLVCQLDSLVCQP